MRKTILSMALMVLIGGPDGVRARRIIVGLEKFGTSRREFRRRSAIVSRAPATFPTRKT